MLSSRTGCAAVKRVFLEIKCTSWYPRIVRNGATTLSFYYSTDQSQNADKEMLYLSVLFSILGLNIVKYIKERSESGASIISTTV